MSDRDDFARRKVVPEVHGKPDNIRPELLDLRDVPPDFGIFAFVAREAFPVEVQQFYGAAFHPRTGQDLRGQTVTGQRKLNRNGDEENLHRQPYTEKAADDRCPSAAPMNQLAGSRCGMPTLC
jgi:hypothetical protein